jgi:hypothetical protein
MTNITQPTHFATFQMMEGKVNKGVHDIFCTKSFILAGDTGLCYSK